jgi:hypothetical protein
MELTDQLMDFPFDKLTSRGGTISKDGDCFSIEIPFEEFQAHNEVIETSIRLDGIDFGIRDFQELGGRIFTFPVNPEDGYIDGSMYLLGAHNPVDVIAIRFGAVMGKSLTATFTMRFLFEFEGTGYKDADLVYTAKLIAEFGNSPSGGGGRGELEF